MQGRIADGLDSRMRQGLVAAGLQGLGTNAGLELGQARHEGWARGLDTVQTR